MLLPARLTLIGNLHGKTFPGKDVGAWMILSIQ
jgi:hypothetical protein